MIPLDTRMAQEAMEAAEAAERQIRRHAPLFEELGQRLRALRPRVVVTCARGSSDHAATYGKYLLETRLGLPVASVGPSVVSVYGTALDLKGQLFIAVSQSGRSPDLLRLAEGARAGGALTVAFVNDETSPLATVVDIAILLCAGPETSVAATKSFLTSLLAFLQLTAHWTRSPVLHEAVATVPDALRRAAELDWYPALAPLSLARTLYVVGRGLGLGPAMEMALKFKETCRLHAEAFSAAEVVHGPLALVGPGFPVVAIGQDDATAATSTAVLTRMAGLGASVYAADERPAEGADNPLIHLPVVPGLAPEVAPFAAVQSFYLAVPRIARDRGLDPDVPPNLRKVTETV
ncbi:MAG: hypothetical protein RLY86_949 [Pseudomonadota bacterium]|jgi:glucosamine--fructose-6-phosphate aminotransferase (isomerizing)